MYCIKTYVDKSPIHGLGVFAGEDIAEGTKIWEFVEGFDQVIPEENVAKFPQQAQDYLETYAYVLNGKLFLCGDHGVYTNHSDVPNTGPAPGAAEDNGYGYEVALRDIKKGEEITSDYRVFDEVSRDHESETLFATA